MQLNKSFNYSYWEMDRYFRVYDLVIIGSGIVGLSTAISFKERHRKARVLILEKGRMPDGASTKNAGFACFGSPGELLDDLDKMPEKTVWETVKMRWQGLQLLRSRLKDKNIGFKLHGGFELFDNQVDYEHCLGKMSYLNTEIKRNLGLHNCYRNAPAKARYFNSVKGVLVNAFEGQIDTGLMMMNLVSLAREKGVEILNNVTVSSVKELNSRVELNSDAGIFRAEKLVVATNGFANSLLKIKDLQPARAQVLITKPIRNLKIKGTFHFQQGYYYFRNIHDRILLGGGRNLDLKGETTPEQGLHPRIQRQLDRLLKNIILPDTAFEVEQRWSGIMGVGSEKKPIIRKAGKNIVAAVRMGGMGIAIGSLVGENAAREIS